MLLRGTSLHVTPYGCLIHLMCCTSLPRCSHILCTYQCMNVRATCMLLLNSNGRCSRLSWQQLLSSHDMDFDWDDDVLRAQVRRLWRGTSSRSAACAKIRGCKIKQPTHGHGQGSAPSAAQEKDQQQAKPKGNEENTPIKQDGQQTCQTTSVYTVGLRVVDCQTCQDSQNHPCRDRMFCP
jgi:hypothetical protein